MRKLKSHFFISLDGVVESPNEWHFPYFNDEMGAAVGAGFSDVDAVLMGRVLYDEWAAYWPQNADQPFGAVINDIKKYVVSDSLQTAEWQNTEIVSGDVAGTLAGPAGASPRPRLPVPAGGRGRIDAPSPVRMFRRRTFPSWLSL